MEREREINYEAKENHRDDREWKPIDGQSIYLHTTRLFKLLTLECKTTGHIVILSLISDIIACNGMNNIIVHAHIYTRSHTHPACIKFQEKARSDCVVSRLQVYTEKASHSYVEQNLYNAH